MSKLQQPEIKKYRRKVSDERVAEVKKRFDMADILSVLICPSVVRGVLEADAEVAHGSIELQQYSYHNAYGLKVLGEVLCEYNTLEQFNAEWEEIG